MIMSDMKSVIVPEFIKITPILVEVASKLSYSELNAIIVIATDEIKRRCASMPTKSIPIGNYIPSKPQ